MRSSGDAAVPRLRRTDGSWREEVAERARAADRLVVTTDFDGTVAGIREDPDAARIRPDARLALSLLAGAPGTDVAVVSGRALADVRERVDVSGVAYAGNHGLEIAVGDDRRVHPDAESAAAEVRRAVERIRAGLDDVDGALLEEKGLTATVHYRRVDDEATVERVRELVRREADHHDDLRVTDGKQIREIRPAVDWDKGDAVRWILDALDAKGPASHPLYLGDDVTDEAAFRALAGDGTTVVVGDRTDDTAADYRLPGPAAVGDFLTWLAEVRGDE